MRRVSGISLKISQPDQPPHPLPEPETDLPPITLQELTPCWKKALAQLSETHPKLAATLADKEIRIDGDNHFVIVVDNDYSSADIKPHLVQILAILRSLSNRPLLNCATEVTHIVKETKPYTARDKYEAMSRSNPTLETFRTLFPEIDI